MLLEMYRSTSGEYTAMQRSLAVASVLLGRPALPAHGPRRRPCLHSGSSPIVRSAEESLRWWLHRAGPIGQLYHWDGTPGPHLSQGASNSELDAKVAKWPKNASSEVGGAPTDIGAARPRTIARPRFAPCWRQVKRCVCAKPWGGRKQRKEKEQDQAPLIVRGELD